MTALPRCSWASDGQLARYHDEEWGIWPASDDACFEALSLEIFQAGLSWRTILHKREGFRRAFRDFAIREVAAFDEEDVRGLLEDAAIVRHRGKIEATIANARAAQAIQQEHGSLRDWIAALPADPAEAHPLLRQYFTFFGPTTCRSFFEAVGIAAPRHEPGCGRAEP